ncbi:hypothetical protein L9F63_024794, partial [Diploptera punctata]
VHYYINLKTSGVSSKLGEKAVMQNFVESVTSTTGVKENLKEAATSTIPIEKKLTKSITSTNIVVTPKKKQDKQMNIVSVKSDLPDINKPHKEMYVPVSDSVSKATSDKNKKESTNKDPVLQNQALKIKELFATSGKQTDLTEKKRSRSEDEIERELKKLGKMVAAQAVKNYRKKKAEISQLVKYYRNKKTAVSDNRVHDTNERRKWRMKAPVSVQDTPTNDMLETPILKMDTLDKSLLKEEVVPENIQTDIPKIPSKVVETFEISSQTPATTTSEDAVQTFKLEIQEIASQTNNEELNVITEVYSKTSPEIEPVEIQEIASQTNKEELNLITDVYSQKKQDKQMNIVSVKSDLPDINKPQRHTDLTEKKRSRSEDEIERELKKLDNRVHDTDEDERRKWRMKAPVSVQDTPTNDMFETPILEMDTLDKSLLKEEVVPENIQTDIPKIPSKVVETFEISSQTPATITSEDAVQTFKLEIQEIASQANNEELNRRMSQYLTACQKQLLIKIKRRADLTEKKRSRSEDEIERELKKLGKMKEMAYESTFVETFEISSQTPATTTSEDAVQTFKLEIQEIASQTNNEELNVITEVYSKTSPEIEPVEIQEIASQTNKEELNPITDPISSEEILLSNRPLYSEIIKSTPKHDEQLELLTEERKTTYPEKDVQLESDKVSVDTFKIRGEAMSQHAEKEDQSDKVQKSVVIVHPIKPSYEEITEERGSVEVLPESNSDSLRDEPLVHHVEMEDQFDKICGESELEVPEDKSEASPKEKSVVIVHRIKPSYEEITEERGSVEVLPESNSESDRISFDISDSLRDEPLVHHVEMEDQFDKICGESELEVPEDKSEASPKEKSVVIVHPMKPSYEEITEERGSVEVLPESNSVHPIKPSHEEITEERGSVEVLPESNSESDRISFDISDSLRDEPLVHHVEMEDQFDKICGESELEVPEDKSEASPKEKSVVIVHPIKPSYEEITEERGSVEVLPESNSDQFDKICGESELEVPEDKSEASPKEKSVVIVHPMKPSHEEITEERGSVEVLPESNSESDRISFDISDSLRDEPLVHHVEMEDQFDKICGESELEVPEDKSEASPKEKSVVIVHPIKPSYEEITEERGSVEVLPESNSESDRISFDISDSLRDEPLVHHVEMEDQFDKICGESELEVPEDKSEASPKEKSVVIVHPMKPSYEEITEERGSVEVLPESNSGIVLQLAQLSKDLLPKESDRISFDISDSLRDEPLVHHVEMEDQFDKICGESELEVPEDKSEASPKEKKSDRISFDISDSLRDEPLVHHVEMEDQFDKICGESELEVPEDKSEASPKEKKITEERGSVEVLPESNSESDRISFDISDSLRDEPLPSYEEITEERGSVEVLPESNSDKSEASPKEKSVVIVHPMKPSYEEITEERGSVEVLPESNSEITEERGSVEVLPESNSDQFDKICGESELEVPEDKSEASPKEKSVVIVHPIKPSYEEITEERGSVEVLPESNSGIVLQLAQVSKDLLPKESDRISFDISDSLRDEPLVHHVEMEDQFDKICGESELEVPEDKSEASPKEKSVVIVHPMKPSYEEITEERGSVEVLPESNSESDRISFDISDSLRDEPLVHHVEKEDHSEKICGESQLEEPEDKSEPSLEEKSVVVAHPTKHSSEEIAQEKDDRPVEQEERERVEVDPDIVLQHEPVKQFVEMEDQFDKICGESQLEEPEDKSEPSLEEKSVVVAHPIKHSSEKIIQEKDDGPVEQEERGRVDVHPESGSESGKTSFDTPTSLTEQVITHHVEKEDQSDKFHDESQFEVPEDKPEALPKEKSVVVIVVHPTQPSSEEITQVGWNKANNIISKRIKNLQNAKETTHMSGILCLATLEEIVTEESVEQQSENVQRNLNLLCSAVETKDVIFIKKTVITTMETISTWLQTIEYRVYLSRQNMNTSPSVDKVKEYNDLRAEISRIEESVGELGGVLDTASEICNNEDKIKMHEYITTLKDQMKAVEEMARQNEQKVTNDLTHWEEFLNGVNNIHVLVQELKQKFEDLVQSDVSAKAKLVELEEIESVNRCHMGKTIQLLSTARNLIKEFPDCDIPPETMTAHETTKILERNIILVRERLLHLLSLIEDYEQTMKELSQIIDIADVLVESPICVVSLEHLQEEMQKHSKFFVNLSHCRGILKSLEQNLDPYSQLHQALHCRATVILDKAAYRTQQMAMAASRWTVLEQGMKEETGWLQVAHQRVPDLQSVKSSDYDQYINLYQTLSSDVAVHYARIIQLLSIAHRLQELVTCLGLEARYDEHLETILKLQDDVNTNLQRLLTFRDTWTLHEVMINKLEYWMREAEQDLDAMSAHSVTTGQFWELKAQYEVHNNIHNEAVTTFESAIKIIPVADEVVQRQLNAELEKRWKEVANHDLDLYIERLQSKLIARCEWSIEHTEEYARSEVVQRLSDLISKAKAREQRIREIRNIKNCEIEKSAIAAHSLLEHHKIGREAKLLKQVEKPLELTVWEKIYIQKNKNRSMNFDIPNEITLISNDSARLTCPLCSSKNWQQLDNDLWRLEQWLQFAEGTQSSQTSPPTHIEPLEDVIQDHREFLMDMDSHKSIVVSLNIVGNLLADHTERAEELRNRLVSTNARWDEVCRNAANWQTQLQTALMENQQFHQIIVELLDSLTKTENKIRQTEPVDLNDDIIIIEAKYNQFRELRSELERCEPRVISLQEAADQLLRHSPAPEGANTTWTRLTDLRLKLQSLRRLTGVYILKLGAVLGRSTPLMSLSKEYFPVLIHESDNGTIESEVVDTTILAQGYHFLGRVVRASLSIQAVMVLPLGVAYMVPTGEEDYSCVQSYNIARSFEPMLRYPNGPPPV